MTPDQKRFSHSPLFCEPLKTGREREQEREREKQKLPPTVNIYKNTRRST